MWCYCWPSSAINSQQRAGRQIQLQQGLRVDRRGDVDVPNGRLDIGSDDWLRGRGKLARRSQKEFLENGRISFVVDGQRFGGCAMVGPAASERFVEGAPRHQDGTLFRLLGKD